MPRNLGVPISVVAARREHVPLIVGWMAQLAAQDAMRFDERVGREALERLLDSPDFGQVWLLQLDAEPAGYVVLTFGYSLEFGGRDAFVDELFVAEGMRGHGLGSHAIEFASETCRALGIRALHLEVDHDNPRAQSLYRRSGFVDHDRYLMTRRLV
jgi:GNAT superfamily N-acetyltransferase